MYVKITSSRIPLFFEGFMDGITKETVRQEYRKLMEMLVIREIVKREGDFLKIREIHHPEKE